MGTKKSRRKSRSARLYRNLPRRMIKMKSATSREKPTNSTVQSNREQIKGRMAELGTTNMSGFIRRMALYGYAIRVDISPLQELVSLQRRCVNNLAQIAKHVHSDEITALQKDYAALWEQISEVLRLFTAVMKL